MSVMSRLLANAAGLQSIASEAAPPVVLAPPAGVSLALQGDEIIQFTLRPSLWYIPLVAARWLGVSLALVAGILALARGPWTLTTTISFNFALLLGGGRLAVATLQWASRLYVLTNRRVLRFKGVLSVETVECPLRQIARVRLVQPGLMALLPHANIEMQPTTTQRAPLVWECVARPAHVKQLLERAISRAQE